MTRRLALRLVTLLAVGAIVAVSLVAVRSWPREPLLARFPVSRAVYDANGELLRLTVAADGAYRLIVPLERISPRLVDAVLLHEDRHFHRHPGVNPWSLARGGARTFLRRDRRVGGSTLTMQLARRLHDIDSRSVPGKLAQILRALELELKYNKRQILEAYLNLAPYGANVEGVGAASLVYFHKRPDRLSLPEALALAVIPQSPARRTPIPGNAALERARMGLYARWRAAYGSNAREAAMMSLPLQAYGARELPFHAPHATEGLLRSSSLAEIRATLDLRTQRLIERQVRGFVDRQRRFGVGNAAVLLVDRRDMSVRAIVGSADFFDASIGGQNDGTRARRSPGSALKPFVYALAFEQGLLHPMTVLKDTPQAFGPFAPENFDGEFSGPITAQDALIRSRNVPTVQVGVRLAGPGFHDFLRTAGIARLAPEAHYGIALYLGGAEVSMRELAALYAALGNGGRLRPLRDAKDGDASDDGIALLSPAASFVVLDMLAQNPRPVQAFENGAVRAGAPIAWKTGTSNGFRDAWTAGLFDQYVLVVWLGNFDGRANPAFVGVHLAAPLFFQIVDALRASHSRDAVDPPVPPPALRRVMVCADSGDLPNQWCPRRVPTWYLPGVSPIRVSTLHRRVFVDRRTGRLACPPYERSDVEARVYEYWSSDMLELFARAGLARRTPPPDDETCDAWQRGAGQTDAAFDPRIETPREGLSYLLREDGRGAPLELRATSDGSVEQVYWFVDEAYLGSSARGESLEWHPARPGRFTLRVVDDAGRSAARELRVAIADGR